MIPGAVFALSFSTLLFELALSRWFAVAHWGHLQTIVIAIALFGSAVSGAAMARSPAAGSPDRPGARCALSHGAVSEAAALRNRRDFPVVCLLGSLALIGSFLLARVIPLDYLRFPVDRMQLLWLACAYLCLSLPFFFSGLAACLAYVRAPQRSGRTAFAAMGGSGAGAAAAAFLIPGVGEGMAVLIAALVPLAPAMAAAFGRDSGGGRASRTGVAIGAAGAIAAVAIVLMAVRGSAGLETAPSPYKMLPQLLMMPESRVVSRSESVWGSARVVESPRIRFAPGLSLAFSGRIPPQTAVIVDGDGMTAIADLSAPGSEEYARNTHAYSAHVIAETPADLRSCLVIQRGGGLAVVAAVASKAGRIDLVADSPEAARRAGEAYRSWNVSAVVDNPRSVAAVSGPAYDLIHVEDWGPSVPGMASLSIDALLTTDAFRAYWRRLAADGTLAVSRRLVIPPSDSLRIFACLLEAMSREGVALPQNHVAAIRSWDSCTFLASRSPLGSAESARLRAWCDGMGFDLDWLPGILREDTNRFNRLEDSWFFDSYGALVRDPGYAGGYYLDVAPESDDRPFPSRFVRWTRFAEYLRATGGRAYTLLLSGELVAAAVFLETLLLAAVVLLVSLMPRVRGARILAVRRPPAGLAFLFVFIGFGYIFAEVAFLDALTVAFASPLAAFAVVLGGMLVFSGIGGLAAERLPKKALPLVLFAACILLALAALGPAPAARFLLPLPSAWRVVCSLLLLAAPSTVLGLPFALAVRDIPVPQWRAFAWAANGGASVAAAGAAALIGMGLGVSFLALAASLAYLGAAHAALSMRGAGKSG